ncbi:MAG TPA: hypothetical protein QF468_06745 [Nitrospinota bacterium]|nr:hypothetical protein [Nitrospinota bacterium]
MKNLEHASIDEFNEGETFIGDQMKTFFRYIPIKELTIETGAFLGIPFGDSDRVNPKEPVISFHLDFGPGMRITARTIERRHPLLEAFFDDDQDYTDPIEQGFQLKGENDRLRRDLWKSWEEKETDNTPELFSVGNFIWVSARGVMLEGHIYWVLHGWQKSEQDMVSNNISMATGVGYSLYPRKKRKTKFISEIGATAHYLYNYDNPSGKNTPTQKNYGVLGKLFMKFSGGEIYYQHWTTKNNGFNPEKGDSLYKAKDYGEVGLEKTLTLGDGIDLKASFKGQFVGGKFVHIDFLSISWQGIFSLFEDYFERKGGV